MPATDIRWFAPNRYCALPVSRLRAAGLRIATEGDEPARLVFASDGAPAPEAWRFAWRHRLPLVAYLWDLQPWLVGNGGPNPVIPIRGRLLKVPRPFGGYAGRTGYLSRLRYIARRAKAVWVPSVNTAVDVARVFGVEPERIPFCYDSNRFNRAAGWQRPPGKPVVLAISRLVPQKRHTAIVRAVARVSTPTRLHVIGQGSEAPEIRRLAEQLGVDLHLDETWQSDQQIVAAYLGASVVVSLSEFEGLGLTPLEGAAMGIPVVASDIPPHREFQGPGVRLVPLDDDEAAARMIDAALRGDHGPAGSTGNLQELTIEACAARLLAGFTRLL